MAFKVVMVGMERWYQQDVVPLREELQNVCGISARNIASLHDPRPELVLRTIAETGGPESLLFYYSGHGGLSNGTFYMATALGGLEDSALVRALRETGAKKILVIVDACHSGGLAVKDEVAAAARLRDLANGSGLAMLAACDQAATTPGSSPLTTAFRKALRSSRDVFDVQSLKEKIEGEHDKVVLKKSQDFADFAVATGMTMIGRCLHYGCTCHKKQVEHHCGLGNFRITTSFFPCQGCHKGLKVEAMHFSACKWRVKYTYVNALSEVLVEDTGFVSTLEEHQWHLQRDSYMTLDVVAQ